METKQLVTYGAIGLFIFVLITIALRKIKEQNNRGGIIAPVQPNLPTQSNAPIAPTMPQQKASFVSATRPSANRYANPQQQQQAKKVILTIVIIFFAMNIIPVFFGFIAMIANISKMDSGSSTTINTKDPDITVTTNSDKKLIEEAKKLSEKGKLKTTVLLNREENQELSNKIDSAFILNNMRAHEVAERFTFAESDDIRISLIFESEDGEYSEQFEFVIMEDKVLSLNQTSNSNQIYQGYEVEPELEDYFRDLVK